MNNLTENQKSIVNQLVDEFTKLNNKDIVSDDPLVNYINKEIDAKRKFLDEVEITNEFYYKSALEKIQVAFKRVESLVSKFGYAVVLKPSNKGFVFREKTYPYTFQISFYGNDERLLRLIYFVKLNYGSNFGVECLLSDYCQFANFNYQHYADHTYTIDDYLRSFADYIIKIECEHMQ